jgi:uncharacterized lipoprotein
MLKKILFPLLAVFLITGCATTSNNLVLNPTIANAKSDPTLMGQTLSINATDARQDKALAKVNREGKLETLYASREPNYLMQEVIDRQMRDRGYMIGNNGDASIQLTINHLFADVQEGNLRYTINTVIDLSILVQAKNGASFTKNYRTSHTIQGAFTANNTNITNALNMGLSEIIAVMANDASVSEFVKQNSR